VHAHITVNIIANNTSYLLP